MIFIIVIIVVIIVTESLFEVELYPEPWSVTIHWALTYLLLTRFELSLQ